MAEQLRAGAATASITPWLGIAMRGAFRDVTHADAVHDELLAKALVLDDGARRIAFVLCDLTMMPRAMMDAAKERIAERTEIPPDHVLIASTHTHSAPATVTVGFMNEQTDYTAWAVRKIADAVAIAAQRLQPARIGFASVPEPRLVFNRRYHMRNGQVHFNPGVGNPDVVEPAGTTDPEFTLCYVENAAGEPIAVLGNYALHYVGTDTGAEISADYFGHFFRAIQHLLGPQTVGLLFNGASGNVNNTNVFKAWPHRGHAQAARMANVLAGHALAEIQLMAMHDHVIFGRGGRRIRVCTQADHRRGRGHRGQNPGWRPYLRRGAVLSGNRPADLPALGAGLRPRNQSAARPAGNAQVDRAGAARRPGRLCRAAGRDIC